MRSTRVFISAFACLGVGAFGLVWAAPQQAACALVSFSGLAQMDNGALVGSNRSADDRARLSDLTTQARNRIEHTYGTPRAQPVLAFFGPAERLGPFKMNPYGSTAFVGSRACVLVGGQGENLDVIAHELMHAELFERVGYWRRWVAVPTWFDEGVAMQVDHRSAYDLPAFADTGRVRLLETANRFFVTDDAQLTWNYAAAKREVAHWLAAVGTDGLYPRLDRLRAGDSLEQVMRP